MSSSFRRTVPALLSGALLLAGCGADASGAAQARTPATVSESVAPADSATAPAAPPTASADAGPTSGLPANELGRIMVLEYHRLGDKEGEWYRSPEHFRQDLQTLYEHGYRPVTMREVLSGNINVPAGTTPVVFVFDDSSKGQFYYQPDGSIDPNSMVGMWEAFRAKHPGWSGGATWCVLPGADYPSNFWGEKKSKEIPRAEREATIRKKVDFLLSHGHEICNHTMWHARLDKYPDAFVQDQIGSAIDSVRTYLPADYKIVTFALPLGMWPKNRPLAWQGTYRNGKTYRNEAVLEVAGGPNVSPFDKRWDPRSIKRLIAAPGALEQQIAAYQKDPADRYVSDGNPRTVAYPEREAKRLDPAKLYGNKPTVVPAGAPPAGK